MMLRIIQDPTVLNEAPTDKDRSLGRTAEHNQKGVSDHTYIYIHTSVYIYTSLYLYTYIIVDVYTYKYAHNNTYACI